MSASVQAGWWHNYVCPTHDVELEPWSQGAAACRYGCRLDGQRYREAWAVLDLQSRARELRRLARTDPARARRELEALAVEYASLPEGENDGAESWMLRGRLFAQALTESIWAVQVADASHATGAAQDQRVRSMLEGLLETVTRAWQTLVVERQDERSNYAAWLAAAGSLLSLALGEQAGRQEWLVRLDSQASVAVGTDGWEWEGATYYHCFVLRAYLLAMRDRRPSDIPDATVRTLRAMTDVLTAVATSSGRLPMLHDGPYDRAAAHLEVLEICVLARQLWSDPGLGMVEQWVRERLGSGYDGLEDLLSWFEGPALPGRARDRGSVFFPDVGFAVLRDPADTWQAVLDGGPHGGSHGHLDKGALYLYGTAEDWQPAPGVPPYASTLRHGHYRRSHAHPTVRIDGNDQVEATGVITEWSATPEVTRVALDATAATPGARFHRTVVMTDGLLIDLVGLSSDDGAEHRYTLGFRPQVPLKVRRDGRSWTTQWSGAENLVGHHYASADSECQVTPGRGPSDDPARIVAVLDWSSTGHDVLFCSVYNRGRESLVTRIEVSGAIVSLTLSDGHQVEVQR